MPLLHIFSTPAEVGDGIDASSLEPKRQITSVARRGDGPVAAVCGEEDWIRSISFQRLSSGEEHGNSRTVLGGVEHLPCFIRIGIEAQFGRPKGGARSRGDIVPIYRGGG